MIACIAKDGVTYARGVTCTGTATKLVNIKQVTTGKDGKASMEYTVDLTGVSDSEIYEHAATNINIQWIRPKLFRLKTVQELIGMSGKVIKAILYRPEAAGKMTDFEKAVKVGEKLSSGEKKALIAKMQKELGV